MAVETKIQRFIGTIEFVDGIDADALKSKDRKYFKKPSGKNKATIGCIGNILRPGKAIQVSIQDNDWISNETLAFEEIRHLDIFLTDLLNI
ncbi:MAG: hypothetical protein GY857_09650 [Desulfobacula sp.]|nr:hypothetical protein [Desulfobacula sp.]